MEHVCVRCTRLALTGRNVTARRAPATIRSLSTSPSLLAKDGDTGVAQSGQSMSAAMGAKDEPRTRPSSQSQGQSQRPLIRRTAGPENTMQPPQQRLIVRRTSAPETNAPTPRTNATRPRTEAAAPQRSQALRRVTVNESGPPQVLRRSGGPPSGQFLNRTRTPGAAMAGRTGAGRTQRQGQRAPGTDRRRRKAPTQEDDDVDHAAVDQDMDAYIAKYVDRPPNPTQPLPYNPTKMTLDDLRSDWPNTPMSTPGMTESVIQKIEWLARRLPHGYQSPEQIAEHYLKGNLTRFESEEEKQLVLKIASDMSAKTKQESAEGTLHKHELPRFQIVEDPAFTSISGKSTDKSYLVHTGVKGDYGLVEKQKYPFLQNAAKVLTNNNTYGPVQMQKLLDRVQALIPQGRGAAAQQVKKA